MDFVCNGLLGQLYSFELVNIQCFQMREQDLLSQMQKYLEEKAET